MIKLVIIFAIAIISIYFATSEISVYFLLDNIKIRLESIIEFVRDNFLLSSFLYMLFYILALITFIPVASILTLLAGSLFGLFWGSILVSFASTIGATLSFLIARYILKDYFEKKFSTVLNIINSNITSKEAYKYLFFLRLNPVISYTAINIALGLTKINTTTFYIISQIGALPGTIIYVNAGRSLVNINSLKDVVSLDVFVSLSLLSLTPFFLGFFTNKIQQIILYKKYKKPSKFDCDILIIGGGAAGLVSAYSAAFVKSKVILIEADKMGGDCLNEGCVPSKAFIHITSTLINYTNPFDESNQRDFERVREYIKKTINSISYKDSEVRYTQEIGVSEVIKGKAHIVSPYQVSVNGRIINTKNIVLATGASPSVPNIKGFAQCNYLTSKNLWDMDKLPQNMIILGAGPVGIEVATCFAKLGSKVTIIEKGNTILPKSEPEAREVISKILQELGIKLILDTNITEIVSSHDHHIAYITNEITKMEDEIFFDKIMVAIGRRPNVTGFGLEGLNLELTDKGAVKTNQYLQTNYHNIFACGDVVSNYQFTHVAAFEAPIVVQNALFGFIKKSKVNYKAIPSVIYAPKEVAQVGLTEEQAKKQNIDYAVAFESIKEVDRAITTSELDGFIKIIINKNNNKILGTTIVCSRAGEMIAEYTMAIRLGLRISAIYNNIYSYPTYSEVGKITLQKYRASILNTKIFKMFRFLHKMRNLIN